MKEKAIKYSKDLNALLIYKRLTKEEIENIVSEYFGCEKKAEDINISLGMDFGFTFYKTVFDDDTQNSGTDFLIDVFYLKTNEKDKLYITEISVCGYYF